ncbi:MAG: hypothetical protein Q4P20_06475 [Eubacteriales bacterium]|nr:hypothetical protein [Eubacteriales bacterium]
MNSKWKRPIATLLMAVGVLGAVAGFAGTARAAIDQTKKCTVAVTPVSTTEDSVLADAKNADVVVDLYKVADVAQDGSGKFEVSAVEAYRDIIPSDMTVLQESDWSSIAQQAADIALGSTQAKTVLSADGTAQGNIDTGLYLLLAHGRDLSDYEYTHKVIRQSGDDDDAKNITTISTIVQSDKNTYVYAPQLVVLPSTSNSTDARMNTADNNWIYGDAGNPIRIVLKPDIVPHEGVLQITKTLARYARSQGNSISVFHITGTNNDTGEKYDKYVAMEFTQARTQTISVDDIPEGMTVTIEEVYSGACYSVVGSKARTVEIPEDGTASVSFSNDYNGSKNCGGGIINHFEYTEGTSGTGTWQWTPESASATPGTAADKAGN